MGAFTGYDDVIKEADNKETKADEMGKKLISFLGLKVKKDGKIDTEWGAKTPQGLWVTMERVIKDIKTGKM